MANTVQTFGSEVTLPDVSALQSLASSATVGWQGEDIDFAGAIDAEFNVALDFANTAPANSKGVYVFLAPGIGSAFASPTSGVEGSITLPDVTANALHLRPIAFIPYVTADEAVINIFRVKDLPPKGRVVVMNHSGAALAASGNSIKYTPITYTTT